MKTIHFSLTVGPMSMFKKVLAALGVAVLASTSSVA